MRLVSLALTAMLASGATLVQAQADPRVGLAGGLHDAKQAAWNITLVSHRDKPAGFFDSTNVGSFFHMNSDFAFQKNLAFMGSFHGWQVWDISNPAAPSLRKYLDCPGGQGDLSIYKHLLFMSVEMPNGEIDCGSQGSMQDTVRATRFRGVRVFDISDLDHPKQVAAVQTCRGSHTHTLVTDPNDPANVYIYVQGTGPVRSATELAGCSAKLPSEDPNSSLFRIEVIKVPVAAPQDARVVNTPRIFSDSANIAGLWAGGEHGAGTQSTARTDQCHDITVYQAIGIAAGACSGNGIVLDIKDPANPRRIAETVDPNFAYWHSATINNDGDKILFTDEWGGGMQPRCRATDPIDWGADAIFSWTGGKLHPAGHFKMPAPQSAIENCVAHNGSLVPVPGRDIMVQAWYQGGLSVFDFTDPNHPQEIAFFDRGPIDTTLALAGFWSTYWYNGRIYGSEIGRGLDVFDLVPSRYLSKNELEAARLVHFDEWNPQTQQKIVWPAAFVVARAYLDQLVREDGLRQSWARPVYAALDAAEKQSGPARKAALTRLAGQLDVDAKTASAAKRVAALAGVVRELAK